jgi:hypothetical protein
MSYERDVFARGVGPILTVDRAALKQLVEDEDSPAVWAILAGTKTEQTMWFEEFLAEYGKLIEASKLPLPEANKEFERLEAEVQDSPNPLIRLLMPAVGGTNQKHARVDTRIEKLETTLRDAETSAGKSN